VCGKGGVLGRCLVEGVGGVAVSEHSNMQNGSEKIGVVGTEGWQKAEGIGKTMGGHDGWGARVAIPQADFHRADDTVANHMHVCVFVRACVCACVPVYMHGRVIHLCVCVCVCDSVSNAGCPSFPSSTRWWKSR